MKQYEVIDSVEKLQKVFEQVRAAQKEFSTFTQEQVDKIFIAAASAAAHQRIPLAQMACAESGMGIVEDKVIKNHYAAEYTYNKYKDTKTVGVIEEDLGFGLRKIAEPVGVVGAVIPTTNPTSTAIFKSLLCLKTRNGIVISPHPRAKNCTCEAAKVVLEAAEAAGAPKGIIAWIQAPSLELTNEVMKSADYILATGGGGMVRSAYSSGTPALGVGSGNTPSIIDDSADIKMAVNSTIMSKTFDNGVICASEQSVIVLDKVYDAVRKEFIDKGCHVLSKSETDIMRKFLIIDGALNTKVVGQPAAKIAEMAGIKVEPNTKILIGEVESVARTEAFAHEKLSPVLAMYRAKDFDDALNKADTLVMDGGKGHTCNIYINKVVNGDRLKKFEERMKAGRILVNTPTSHGAIGDLFNFKLPPSLTLGCGSWGGNATSENVGIKHLLNIKTVAERTENMLWFRAPNKVYHKTGCLGVALDELRTVYKSKKVFIVTDDFLFKAGKLQPVIDLLESMGIAYKVFDDVQADPKLSSARAGGAAMLAYQPDTIITVGGGSAIDAAKMMWILYEHPDVDFADLNMRFMDIRKRVYFFPKMGQKATFIAVATTAGTGSEVTPFAVITCDDTGKKFPIADYQLLPHMAIIDAQLMWDMPKGLTASSGVDVITHAMEAYVSMLATPHTNGLALEALKLCFKWLRPAVDEGALNPTAREKMGDASCIAGMAFANAFLGICHSTAHKLGARFGLPHGVANALLLDHVIKYNASDNPTKMGAFSQYKHPHASDRYAEVADALQLGGNTKEEKVANLIKEFRALRTHIGIKSAIKDYGIDEANFKAQLKDMATEAFDDQCTGANPVYPLIQELEQIYLDAYYGKQ